MAINTHRSHNSKERKVISTADSFPPYAGQKYKKMIKQCLTTSTSASSKRARASLYSDGNSPYLAVDKVHLLTKISEKKYTQKKSTHFKSSFPIATNLYKASSDEFGNTVTRGSKKAKKSVHTLPNVPAPIQKECTVSDMTESEYFNRNEGARNAKPRTVKSKPKAGRKRRDLPYIDRDERYCSDFNLNIYGSSTDTLELEDRTRTGQEKATKKQGKDKENAIGSDVWTVLRSINKFQFKPRPCVSEVDTPPSKKTCTKINKYQVLGTKKRNLRKNTRVVESNRTEECVFVSTVDYYGKARSSTLSPNMSTDQITVINETNEFRELCNKVQRKLIMNHTVRVNGHQPNNTESKTPYKKTKRIKVAVAEGESLNSKRPKTIDNYLICNPKSKNPKKVEIIRQEIEDRPYIRGGINITNNNCKLTLKHFDNPIEDRQLTKLYQVDKNEFDQTGSMYSMHSDSRKAVRNRESCCSPKPLSSKTYRLHTSEPNRGKQRSRLRKTHVLMDDGEYQISIPSESNTQTRSLVKKSRQTAKKPPEGRHRVANKKDTLEKNSVSLKGKESINLIPHLSDVIEKQLAEWYNENEHPSNCDQFKKKKGKTSHLPIRPKNTSEESRILSPKELKSAGIRRASKSIMMSSEQSCNTDSEVKNQLSKFRYPIIILEKEQVNKGVRVTKEDPPQFNGLGKHIWPFMQSWYDIKELDEKPEIGVVLPDVIDERKTAKICLTRNIKKIYPKDNKHVHEDQKTLSVTQLKKKTIHNLKDKMIKLFSVKKGFGNEFYPNEYDLAKKKKITKEFDIASNTDASTVTNVSFKQSADQMVSRIGEGKELVVVPKNRKKPRWARTNWASEFIENVMKKVKSGVYYSSEVPTRHGFVTDPKNTSMQTILTAKPLTADDKIHDKDVLMTNVASDITFTECKDPFKNIVGFDHVDDNLEVKTLNMYEIAVKHKVTNILVKFDVVSGTKALARHFQTPLYTPLAVTESRTQIFKCKTTIFNHMLPAELCTLIPEMMHNLFIPGNVLDTVLPTISEITTTSQSLQDLIQLPVLPIPREISTIMSSKLHRLIRGIYGSYPKISVKNKTLRENVEGFLSWRRDILPRLSTSWLICSKNDPTLTLPLLNDKQIQNYSSKHEITSRVNNCTSLVAMNSNALQSYATLQNNIDALKKTIVWSQMRDYFSRQNITKLDISTLFGPSNQITINLAMESANNVTKVLKIYFDGFGKIHDGFVDIESNAIHKTVSSANKEHQLKCIELSNKPIKTDVSRKQPSLISLKANRRSYVKLYRKCKSTSSIPMEKSTPLKKITSLDDFFQALGSTKAFSSVVDGGMAKIVMSSLLELQNWICNISPRQALLVLLLSNKKETMNLARVRPIILQAIAVNRITRASELDMEIEVILKEKICHTQLECEGLPESSTNRNSLLEELCWIAKTTASDYQKPFDESSEKLLKSLLAKRKQLNPSYLRVMARYVGLGLLKSIK